MKFKMLKWLVAGVLLLSIIVMAKSDNNNTDWIPKVDIPKVDIPKVIIPKAIIPKAIIPKAPDIPEISIPEISIPQIKVQENEEWAVITLAADVLFDFDRWQIRPAAHKALTEVLKVLTVRYAGLPLQLHGHTDAKGTDAYNMQLSKRRVQSVKSWFIRHGISVARITTFAHGESQPVAPNTKKDGSDNPEGRQLNRRVEIFIRKVVEGKGEAPSVSDTRSIPLYTKADNETDFPNTLQTFSKFSIDDLKMFGVITPPKNAYIQEEYKGVKLIATPKRSYTKKQLSLLKYFIDRTPSVLLKEGPSAIINADVGLVSRAQASGPYIYFDSSDFSTNGFFSAGSLEGVFRSFIHELVHIYQFRYALKEADLTKAREKFRRSKSQTMWDSLVMKSSLIESFADVTEWKLTTYKYIDDRSARLEDFSNAKTSNYGRVSIIEDMAETISLVVVGNLTELSKQRIQWTVDLLGYKSLENVLHYTFPYAKLYKLVLMGSGITHFDSSKKEHYKKQYQIIDIAHFISDRKGKHYQEIVSLLEQGFHQRTWEKVLSKELTLKNHIKKHIFEYRGKWRDLYVEVISYEDATDYLRKPEETIITVLSGYRL